MTETAASFLNRAQLAKYAADGYLVIDDFLTAGAVDQVRADLDRVCRQVAEIDRDRGGFNLEKAFGADALDGSLPARQPGLLRKISGAVFEVPAIHQVFCTGPILDCINDLMGSPIYYHSSKVFFKQPNGGSAKPWHQDAAYWSNYGTDQITAWIAIDDADEGNGCVWAIPGSHRLGLIPHVAKELQVEESRLDIKSAVPVPVKSGGLLLFHSLVVHMSKRNESDRPRRAIICDYDSRANPAMDAQDRFVQGMDAAKVWKLR